MSASADRLVDALIADISDRRGLKHEWARIDADAQAEIRCTWATLFDYELDRCSARLAAAALDMVEERERERAAKVCEARAAHFVSLHKAAHGHWADAVATELRLAAGDIRAGVVWPERKP